MEFLFEVSAKVDDDEVDTEEKMVAKEKEIRRVIESIDPSIAILVVENTL
jgi:hypothetical protein